MNRPTLLGMARAVAGSGRFTPLVLASLFLAQARPSHSATFLPPPERAKPVTAESYPPGIPANQEFLVMDDMVFRVSKLIQSGFAGTAWTDGDVFYEYDSNVTALQRTQWVAATREWESIADVCFIPRTTEPNYIHVMTSTFNRSYVGMQGNGQTLEIFNWDKYVIAHEIGHALGLIHEHQRSDRNAYVQINWSNIQGGMGNGNFTLIGGTVNRSNYDFESIMHYDQCAFSRDCPQGSSCNCINVSITVLPPNQAYRA